MADIIPREKRSEMMASIKAKDTKPEVFFRKGLFQKGYRYALHSTKIDGHPDLFLRKYNTAIFVNGCFWHRHSGCKYSYMPKSNIDFWEKKFRANVNRDAVVREQLHIKGIKCLVIWECRIKQMMKSSQYEQNVYDEVTRFLNSTNEYLEI